MYDFLVERIQNTDLTKTERKIADYFLKNPEQVGMLSSSELAKKIHVSDASIIRFSRAIGYSGFLALKNDVYLELVSKAVHAPNKRTLTERFEVSQSAEEDLSRQYLDTMQQNLALTFAVNPPERYGQVVDMLLKADHKYIVGLRGCKGIGAQFARLLHFVTNHITEIQTADSDTIGDLLTISERDILVMFVLSRFYKVDMTLVKAAHARGAKICVITDSQLAPMIPYADVVLIAQTACMSFFHSTVGIDMIAEYLITLLTYQDRDHSKKRIEERDRYLEEYLL